MEVFWAHAVRHLALRKLYRLRGAPPFIGLMDGRKIDFTKEEIANARRQWQRAMGIIRASDRAAA
jgi:hypothetical protein